MPLDLTDEEHAALVRLLRRAIDEDRFPYAPAIGSDQSHPRQARSAGTETGTAAGAAAGDGPTRGQGRRR